MWLHKHMILEALGDKIILCVGEWGVIDEDSMCFKTDIFILNWLQMVWNAKDMHIDKENEILILTVVESNK